METSEIAPLVASVAAVGALVVAVIALSSRLVSKSLDERLTAFGALQDERLTAFGALQDERMKALGALQDERMTAFGALQDERMTALGKQIDEYEKRNGEEHAALGARIDKANDMLQEIRDLVMKMAAGGGPKGWTA